MEKFDPKLFNDATRRGSVLSGKLVTRRESSKEPRSACLRRRKSSLAPGRLARRGSASEAGGRPEDEAGGSKTASPGQLTPRSGNISRRGSVEPNSEAMEALRQFQMKNSKSYKSQVKPAAENLGVALKMIKKRRSLFEHGI